MKLKTKLALLCAGGLVAVSAMAGAGTYAFYSSNAVNASNAVTAGTLLMSSLRDDVPNVGPMFYTDTTGAPGTLATGLWAPGDSNTRGLFLSNTGSLEAKLKTITAKSADKNGAEVTSGADFAADTAFADHSNVIVWQLNWFDSNQTPLGWGTLDSTTLNLIMQVVSDGYNQWAAGNPNADPAVDPNQGDLMVMAVNQQLLQSINDIKKTITGNGGIYANAQLQVTQMHDAPMASLLNQNLDVSGSGVSALSGEAQLLAFTVTMKPDSGNDMQGVSGYFNFNTYWEQAANN